MKTNYTKLIATVILSNFLLINFVFAQGTAPTPTPSTPETIILDKAKEAKAQTSEAECRNFATDVRSVFSGQLTTGWRLVETPVGINDEGAVPMSPGVGLFGTRPCVLVPSNWEFKDGFYLDVDHQNIPEGTKNIQIMIQEGKGITQKDVAAAQISDLQSQNNAGGFSKIIGWFLNFLLSVVNSFLLWMTALAGDIFTTAVHWILDAKLPNFVTVGWTIVRDLTNMFFILILIVIGLAAILRIESYDYRHLLVETVIMALLVNFSMVIATTIIDGVNVLTNMFVTTHGDIWAFVYRYVNFSDLGSLPNGWMAGLFQGLTKLLFTFVALASFLALAGLFIIRIVGMYVLIIFSPLAYALDILPATKHYAHEWWQYFIKYLVWPPVALFMLRLAMLVAKDKSFTASDSAFNYIILMAFIWGAVIMAEHAGMVGGKAVVNGAEKISHGIAHLGLHATDKWLAKGAGMEGDGFRNTTRRVLSYASPTAWKKGYEARHHHQEAEAYTVAAGKRADTLNKYINWEDSDFALKARNARIADEMKQIPMKDKGEMTERAAEYYHHGEMDKALGYTMKLTAQGDLNEILNKLGYSANARGLQKMFDEQVVPKMGAGNAYRIGAELSKIAEEQNQWNFAGAFSRNEETKEYQKNDDPDTIASIQRSKGNPQNNLRVIGRLGAGFVEVDDKERGWLNTGIDQHGVDYLRSIQGSQFNEWDNNGNKHLKANIVANNSARVLEINPRAWATAANEYAQLSPEGRLKLRQTVAAPSDPTQVITREHAKKFIASDIYNDMKQDDKVKKSFEPLVDYANGSDYGDMAKIIVRETAAPPEKAHSVITKEIEKVYSGSGDINSLKVELNKIGMATTAVAQAAEKMSSSVAKLKVGNLRTSGISGMSANAFKRTITKAIQTGLSAGHKFGSPEMKTTIINTLKAEDSSVSDADAARVADEIK